MTVIRLPFPPGSNNLYPGRGKRFKSREYTAWIQEAGLELMAQRPRKFLAPVNVSIELHRPDDRRRDIDGLIKAPIDLLVRHSVLPDDNWKFLASVTARWAGLDRENPRAIVTVEQAGPDA